MMPVKFCLFVKVLPEKCQRSLIQFLEHMDHTTFVLFLVYFLYLSLSLFVFSIVYIPLSNFVNVVAIQLCSSLLCVCMSVGVCFIIFNKCLCIFVVCPAVVIRLIQ